MKPYYEDGITTIYNGDCREILSQLRGSVVIADPNYGETSLDWDEISRGWVKYVNLLVDHIWCFGSMRFFMAAANEFADWKFAQDIVWEKQNGSSFHADRFKRVHEHILHFYRGEWGAVYKSPVKTMDATARTVRRKGRPAHMGHIEEGHYTSEDGGPRLMRSVFHARNCHGYAEHPTQKPLEIILPIIEYSCPLGGTVIDPFMGSGTTLVAAKKIDRFSIGIEIEEKYCEIAAKRLSQGVLEFSGTMESCAGLQ